MKTSSDAKEALIDQTIALWAPRLGRQLSREDARQIIENVSGVFSILAEWARAEMPSPANDNCRSHRCVAPGEVHHD